MACKLSLFIFLVIRAARFKITAKWEIKISPPET